MPPAPPEPALPPTEPNDVPLGGGELTDSELPGFARAMDYVRTRGTHRSGVPASAWIGLRCAVASSIGMDGEFRADPGGVGMSGASMFDVDGYFARMSSSTYIDRWPD